MTRDYKNVSESRTKKAPKGGNKAVKAEKTLPPWLWMLSGLIIGGFISFLIFLKVKVPETEIAAVEKATKPVQQPKPQEKTVSSEAEKEDRFQFYKILPEREVNVPKQDDPEAALKESAKDKVSPPDSDTVSKKSFKYVLQAGSFARFKDADRRKANLALIGVMSKIHAVESNDKTFYRVRIGPYSSADQLNEIEAILKQNKISSLLMKVKG